MQHLIVAYPELAPADRAWIEAVRERYDPHFSLIAPHWTLVFPADGLDEAALEAHAAAVAAGFAPFAFELRCAMPVRDSFGPLTHLFLAPDAGFGQIVRLHDALYGGMLADRLRLDIPYIPHITIGAFADPRDCKAAADELNRAGSAIAGRVAELSVVAFDEGRVALRRRSALGKPKSE